MQIEAKAELMAISKQHESPNRSAQVDKILLEMAEMRQTAASVQTLMIYGRELEPFQIEDIAKACRRIGMTEREEGETAFPTCPRLVALVRTCERQRKERIRPEMLRPEAREAWLQSGQLGMGEELVDIRGLIAEAVKGVSMDRKALPVPKKRNCKNK